MKRLDLILNGKGGVGKSFFAVNFIQFLKDKSIAPDRARSAALQARSSRATTVQLTA